MSLTGQPGSRGLHTPQSAYTGREWAWEFLRRNATFLRAWEHSLSECVVTAISDRFRKVQRVRRSTLIRDWGCCFTDPPSATGEAAAVFWRPDICADVVCMHAQTADPADPATFRLADIAGRVTLLLTADGVQHVIVQDNGHALQLRVTGASLEEPVRLFAATGFDNGRSGAYMRALRCFNDLLREGRLLTKHFPAEKSGPRLAEVLLAVDLDRENINYREIAVRLFGEDRVASGWNDPSNSLRYHVRHCLRRGQSLMAGEYRRLLS